MAKKLSDLTGVPIPPPPPTTASELAASDRAVGIEIELEGFRGINKAERFNLIRFTDDGSLRNGGLEIVTQPVQGSQIIESLKQVEEVIKECRSLTCSARTGLHVHVDMRRETTKSLIHTLCTYLIFEKSLFKYCGEYRMDNPYCVPLSDIVVTSDYIHGLISSSEANIIRGMERHTKYSALNLRPLLTLGTLEFRIHPGTKDVGEILRWVNILLALVDYGTSSTRTPQDTIDMVCADHETLYQEVLKGYLGPINSDVFNDMLVGARAAQELYRIRPVERVENSLFHKLHIKSGEKMNLKSKEPQIPPGWPAPADEGALLQATQRLRDLEEARRRAERRSRRSPARPTIRGTETGGDQ